MAIKFTCPNCRYPLKVKDELAGKRARCPKCKHVIQLPAVTPAAAPPRDGQPAPTEDLEALAAAALAEEQKPAEPVEQKFIDFTCAFCDEPVQAPAELAGKQMPCPHCRKIVKVPVPEKKGPKDWRTVDQRLPSGARRDEEVLEGAWGSTTSTSRVSTQALVEAEAIPAVKEKLTTRDWIRRGVLAAVVLAVVAGGVWGFLKYRRSNLESQALQAALANPDAIHRGLGEYQLRAGNLKDARQQLDASRQQWLQAGGSARDVGLIELARTQVGMGGDDIQAGQGIRVAWKEMPTILQPTLEGLESPEARVEALREVGGLLIDAGQPGIATGLAASMPAHEKGELLAVIALEMLAKDKRKEAAGLAQTALLPYQIRPGGSKDKDRPQPGAALIALLLALRQDGQVEKALGVRTPAPGKGMERDVRVGYAAGWALQGKLGEARALARDKSAPNPERLDAMAAVAWAVSSDKNPGEAHADLTEALSFLDQTKGSAPSPWALLLLVRAGLRAGLREQAARVVPFIADPVLRGRADLDILQAEGQADMNRLDEAVKQSRPYPLLVEWLARANAREGRGSDVLQAVEGWPEALRPFGDVGVALGIQDGRR
jgi:hypothetical protein